MERIGSFVIIHKVPNDNAAYLAGVGKSQRTWLVGRQCAGGSVNISLGVICICRGFRNPPLALVTNPH